ncbi:MAG: T9SS C-terminal target domain-containing protein [Spirochaetes bacterium]|nr:T9SS C-terminal target domain-containing protein [Spirochaetota bacterium]
MKNLFKPAACCLLMAAMLASTACENIEKKKDNKRLLPLLLLGSVTETSWYTFIGGSGNDYANSIMQTADGGYIIAGNATKDIASMGGKTPINPYSEGFDMIVVKLDFRGAVAWHTFLGESSFEFASSVTQTADGGYIVAGSALGNIPSMGGKTPVNAYSSDYDMVVVKLDSRGVVVWYTFLGGSGMDQAKSVAQTLDGGCIVAGYADTNIASLGGKSPIMAYSSNSDMVVVKLDPSGAVAWYTFLGGSGYDQACSVAQTKDGGYIVAGYAGANIASMGGAAPINAYSSGIDMVVVKLDSSGAVAWYAFLGGSSDDQAYSVAQTKDGGYIVAGSAYANIASMGGKAPVRAYSSGEDMVVVKLDSSGAVAWYTFLGGSDIDRANSVAQTIDGGYIVAGTANQDVITGKNDMSVVKLDSRGSIAWSTLLDGSGANTASSVAQTGDGGYIVAGSAYANVASIGGATPVNAYSSNSDMFVVKLKSNGSL